MYKYGSIYTLEGLTPPSLGCREDNSQREYDDFMSDSKVDKAKKTTDLEHKERKKNKRKPAENAIVVEMTRNFLDVSRKS